MIYKNSFFDNYFDLIIDTISSEEESKFIKAEEDIKKLSKNRNKIMIAGKW